MVPSALTNGVTCHWLSLPKFQPYVMGGDQAVIGQVKSICVVSAVRVLKSM